MASMVYIFLGAWLIGVFVARLQLEDWGDDLELPEGFQKDALSLLSWLIYPIYFINRVINRINRK